MNKILISSILGWVTLLVMAYMGVTFFLIGTGSAWPRFSLFAVAAWLHGICWGYRYALEGRLTWL